MRFSCLSQNLAEGLAIVTKAVSVKGSLPILSHVLLQTDNGRLMLAATDLETSIVTWVGGKMEQEGGITVPARVLTDLMQTLPSGKVDLSVEKQSFLLQTDPPHTRSRINGSAAADFPPLPQSSGDVLFTLEPQKFLDAVNRVVFAAARDESRPVLTGVLIKADGNELRLVGVDGFRLSEKKLTLDSPIAKDFSIIVPSRTLSEASKLLNRHEGLVQFSLQESENQLLLTTDGLRIASRLLEGQFPDYERIVPSSTNLTATISREQFYNAVKLAAVFARDAASVIKIKFAPGEPVAFRAATQDVGDHETKVEALVEGEPLEIAFNSKYLTDVLSVLGEDEIIFTASGPLNPGVFKPTGSDDFFHLVMPVRLG